MHVRCPHCHNPIELVDDSQLSDIECPTCGSGFSLLGEQTATFQKSEARTTGHFDLLEQIGVGAFGAFERRPRQMLIESTKMRVACNSYASTEVDDSAQLSNIQRHWCGSKFSLVVD